MLVLGQASKHLPGASYAIGTFTLVPVQVRQPHSFPSIQLPQVAWQG